MSNKVDDATSAQRGKDKDKEIYESTTHMLLALKLQPEIAGFDYLREAIVLVYKDKKLAESGIKKLYSIVADNFNVSSNIVEKAIRTIVDGGYFSMGALAINEFFDEIVYTHNLPISNALAIYALSEILRLKIMRVASEN